MGTLILAQTDRDGPMDRKTTDVEDAALRRRLYEGYLLSSRGIDAQIRRFAAEDLLEALEGLAAEEVSMRAIGSAFARHIVEDIELVIEGFGDPPRRFEGLKEMAARAPNEAWRLDLAASLARDLAVHAQACPADDRLTALFDLADPDAGWLRQLRRQACEARMAALLEEIAWMTASDPAVSARHLADAFALKERIRRPQASTTDSVPEPNISVMLDGGDKAGQWWIEDRTIRSLRGLIGRHGPGQLDHLGWTVAVQIDASLTRSGSRIGSDRIGTVKIADLEIPLPGGDWYRRFTMLTQDADLMRSLLQDVPTEDLPLKLVAQAVMRIMRGVVDLDPDLPFPGERAPTRPQLVKMARMVELGVAVPNVQQRISMRDAWTYINENNEAFLAKVRDVGVNWTLTQSAQALGVGRIKLSKWLSAQGYLDAFGRPAGEGTRVAVVVSGDYGEQIRWNSKFVESLRPRIAEIDPAAKPTPPKRRPEPAPPLPMMRIDPSRRGELAKEPMSEAQRVTLELARDRYDPADPLANATAKSDYLARRRQTTARQFDICVANGWLDANLQITSLGRWRLGIELGQIPERSPLPPDAMLPNPTGIPDLEVPPGQSPYRIEESAGRPPGPKILKYLSLPQQRALLASWLHGDPARSLPPGEPPATWSSTVYALTSRKWMTEKGEITDLGRWMLALSLKTIPRTTPAPIPVDHMGEPTQVPNAAGP